MPRLSKSRFCAGLQCLKQLWWRVHEPASPELVPPASLQATFDRGSDIGEQARAEFAGGVLVDFEPWRLEERCAATAAALAGGAPSVFEASFSSGGVFAAVDVLERIPGGFALIEVKSTYSVKPQFLPDVAIQVYVTRAAGFVVRRAEVMHLARDPSGGPDRFRRVDVTAASEALQAAIPEQVQAMRSALAGALPNIHAGTHCQVPYECPFLRRCTA